MKQLISLVFAGVIGSMMTLAGFQYLNPSSNSSQLDVQSYSKQVKHRFNVPVGNNGAPLSFADAAEIATPSVVHIKAAESADLAQQRRQQNPQMDPFGGFFGSDFFSPFGGQPRQKEGTGSGVIYSTDGYIVTNNHVVEFADEVEVTLFDNRTYAAEVVGTYPKADLAVLKIDAQNLPVLQKANSDAARVGEWVLAVGNPLELNSTVTAGIISAKARNLDIIKDLDGIESFIQTDAVVNPGNSGGALVDAQGHLLGINTAIKTQTGFYAGYSFAIPVNVMEGIVDDIIEFGDYKRAYLGVNIFNLDSDYANEKGLDLTQGVVIDELVNGGSAQYAGLLPGDVIVGIDNNEIRSAPELQEIMSNVRVGETINVRVNRNGTYKEFSIYLKNT